MRTIGYWAFGQRATRALLLATLLGGMVACGGGGDEAKAEEGGEHAEGEKGESGEHAEAAPDVVTLQPAAVTGAGIQIGTVEAVQTSGLAVTGTITYDANRVSHVGPRIAGRVVALQADVGQRVGGGHVLAILESPEVGQLRADETEAAALVGIAQENYARERRLETQGISSRKELLQYEAELRRAQASLQSARARLAALGASGGSGSRFALAAPFPGAVVARDASLGEMAEPTDSLFTVANLSRVWIELDVFERDLPRVRIGQRVDVTTAAYPGTNFPGQIVYVGDVLDPEKRTVRARVEIPNANGALKPGMFANAMIRVAGGGAATSMAVVPQDAIQELEGRKVVFVPGTKAGEFRAVPVEVGETVDGNRVVLRTGIAPGSRIVTAGAFSLRSELAKGEIGEHGH